jgi:hypothetical protein
MSDTQLGAGAFFTLSRSRAGSQKRARKREEKEREKSESAERERKKARIRLRVLSKMYSSVGTSMLNRWRGKDHSWASLNQHLTALNVNR